MVFEAIWRFFRQSILSFKALFAWLDIKIYILVQIVDPIVQLIFFCLLARYVYDTKDITPWVIGNSFILCAKNTVFGIGNILLGERMFGTLKLIVAVPSNKFIIFTGRAFMHVVDAAIRVVIGLVAGVLLFGVSFKGINMGLFTLNIIIGVFAASGMGLLIGSLGLRIRDMNLVMNTAATSLLALTGANFPIERLPMLLKSISFALPLTRSIKSANMIMEGASLNMVWGFMMQELFIGVIYLSSGYLLLQYMENLSRKSASLDIY